MNDKRRLRPPFIIVCLKKQYCTNVILVCFFIHTSRQTQANISGQAELIIDKKNIISFGVIILAHNYQMGD